MRATCATYVALVCTLCLVHSAFGRLSVFRQDINDIPGIEGQSYVVVNHGEDGPQEIARVHAFHSTGPQTSPHVGALFPSPFEWVSKQLEVVHAFQSQLMLDAAPDAPPTPFDSDMPMDSMLKHVKCHRMRQAMVDDAVTQTMMLEPGMASDMPTATSSPAQPLEAGGMMEDLVGPLEATRPGRPVQSADKLSDSPIVNCYNSQGALVACDSDEAVAKAWDPVRRAGQKPADEQWEEELVRPGEQEDGEQGNLILPGATWQLRGDDEQDSTAGWIGEEGERRSVGEEDDKDDDAAFEDGEDKEEDDREEERDERHGGWRMGMEEGMRGGVTGDDLEVWRQDMHRRGGERGPRGGPHGDWRRRESDREHFRGPPPPPPMLAAAATLLVIAAVVLVLRAVLRRYVAKGWCCKARQEQFLTAPLLATDVYGVKVAAVEAAQDHVQGIDTSAALMKGQPAGVSH